MAVRPQRALRSFALWVALPATAVYVGVCALVYVAMHLMSAEMNSIDANRGRSAIAAAVESLVVSLGDSAADEATWTEAYINTYIDPNPAWLDSAWGSTARISDTYDTAILTDVEGKLVFGETSRGPMVGHLSEHFSGVDKLLADLDSGVAAIGDDATVAHLARNDRGVVALAGAVVHGNTGQASIPKDQRRILWLARQLDDRLLRDVAQRFQLPMPRLVEQQPEVGADSMELTDAAGNAIARLAWQPRRPGDPAFAHTATVATLVMLIIGMLIFAVLAAFRHSIKQRAESEQRDWYNARYDAVTGLINRFGLEEHLGASIPKKRGELPLSVAQLGIDGIVDIIGSYGRETGDHLLDALADHIETATGGQAVLARTGPAEFTLARVGDDGGPLLRGFAERLLADISEALPVGNLKLKVGLSVGLATAPATRQTVGAVIRMAETAMARARETGGNHGVEYDPAIEDERRRRIELQADIRRGLEAGEFDLEYQPIIDFSSQSVLGVEALMRWNRRAGGPMGPGEFIPAAEASGLIDDLGMFALRKAIEEIGAFPRLKISVNVSPAQLRNPTLPQVIFAILDEWGVEPSRLQLEVTESFLVSHPGRAKDLIEQLRQGGILIALDDFGTGYSSIGYLKQFRFDRVKLDRSLVDEIDSDPVQAALVESTMIYAYAMGLSVTAEGVERPEEAVVLTRLGCREFQGYLFARPLRLAQLERLLAEQSLRAAS